MTGLAFRLGWEEAWGPGGWLEEGRGVAKAVEVRGQAGWLEEKMAAAAWHLWLAWQPPGWPVWPHAFPSLTPVSL